MTEQREISQHLRAAVRDALLRIDTSDMSSEPTTETEDMVERSGRRSRRVPRAPLLHDIKGESICIGDTVLARWIDDRYWPGKIVGFSVDGSRLLADVSFDGSKPHKRVVMFSFNVPENKTHWATKESDVLSFSLFKARFSVLLARSSRRLRQRQACSSDHKRVVYKPVPKNELIVEQKTIRGPFTKEEIVQLGGQHLFYCFTSGEVIQKALAKAEKTTAFCTPSRSTARHFQSPINTRQGSTPASVALLSMFDADSDIEETTTTDFSPQHYSAKHRVAELAPPRAQSCDPKFREKFITVPQPRSTSEHKHSVLVSRAISSSPFQISPDTEAYMEKMVFCRYAGAHLPESWLDKNLPKDQILAKMRRNF